MTTTFDAHANLAVATVSPDSTVIGSTLGDTILAESLEAAELFPAVPFNVTVWRDAAPEPVAAEIMRVTAFDGTRTFTVERGQEGTAPLAFIAIGWRFANTVTAGDVRAIEDAVNAEESARAAAIASEAATRAAADSALGAALTAETAARTSADSTLQGEVTAETAARIAGDAATLASAETYADGEVGAEAATRASADTTLQGHIDSEATARTAGDAATLSSAESYADAQVAAEAVLRATGDSTTLATAQAYTDSRVVAAVHYRGAIDASTNPNLPAANLGDLYAISVAGTVSGIAVEAGDMAICKVNATPANTPANWDVIQTNITGAVTGPTSSTDLHFAQFNGATGKVIQDGGLSYDTDGTFGANSDAHIASQRATKTYADGIVAAEAAARAAAITAEASTRATADTNEAATRAAADTALQAQVNTKVSAVRRAIFLRAQGILEEPFSPYTTALTSTPTSGVIFCVLLGLRQGDVIAGVALAVNGAAAGSKPTLGRVGIADKTGLVLAVSGDISAAANWTTGRPDQPFTSPYTILSDDAYYALLLVVGTWGTTQPQLSVGNSTASNTYTARAGFAPGYALVAGQTDLPAVGASLPTPLLPGGIGIRCLAFYGTPVSP